MTKFADHVTICANDAYGNKDISMRCVENSKSDLNHVQTSLFNNQAREVSIHTKGLVRTPNRQDLVTVCSVMWCTDFTEALFASTLHF